MMTRISCTIVVLAKWNLDSNRCSLTRRRTTGHLPSEQLCAFRNAKEPKAGLRAVSTHRTIWGKSLSVILNRKQQPRCRAPDQNTSICSLRMLKYIIQAFLNYPVKVDLGIRIEHSVN